MDITGKLIATCPQQGGTSKAGKEWKSQTFVLETQEQYPRKVAFELFGSKLDEFGALCKEGANLTVSFDIESREFNGRWYTSIRAWKVANSASQEPGAPAEDVPTFADLASAPADPFGDSGSMPESKDLPF